MKKFLILILALMMTLTSSMYLVACGGGSGNGGGSQEGILTIRCFDGGYGSEWLYDSVKNFIADKKYNGDVSKPKEGVDYKVNMDPLITNSQDGIVKNKDQCPDIMITQGGYEGLITLGLVSDISSVFEQQVTSSNKKAVNGKIKIKDLILPEAYQSVKRCQEYGDSDSFTWAMPWQAETFSLVYNEVLLKKITHTDSGFECSVDVGSKWTEAPKTVDELLAYFEDVLAYNTANGTEIKPFGWSYQASTLWAEFLVDIWWAQYQGISTSKIAGQGAYNDFYNFNSLDLLDQKGIKASLETMKKVFASKYGINNITSAINTTINKNAAKGEYAVWIYGDFFETESNKVDSTKLNYSVNQPKMMTLPNIKGADGNWTTEKITFFRSDEVMYVPTNAKNKDLAKEFLAYMCNEKELLNYSKKSGGLRPFDYNPLELDPSYNWTEFQKAFFKSYAENQKITRFPGNVKNAEDISPVFTYNRSQINFALGKFSSFFTPGTDKNIKTDIDTWLHDVKTQSSFDTWKSQYREYFGN